MDEDGDMLYDLAIECETLFNTHVAHLRTHSAQKSAMTDLVEEFQTTFRIWANTQEVFARKSRSLDTSLLNHPDILDLVARLLDILRCSLQHCECNQHARSLGIS